MIRSLFIIFALCAIFLVGLWTQNLRHQIEQLQHKNQALEKLESRQTISEPQPYSQSDSELKAKETVVAAKTQKAGPAATTENPETHVSAKPADPSVDLHIKEDLAAIAKINSKISSLNNDGKIVTERSREFRTQQEQQQKAQKAIIRQQVEANAQAQQVLPAEIQAVLRDRSDPDRAAKAQGLKNQLAALRQQRQGLKIQNENLDLQMQQSQQAIAAEVASEQNEMVRERAAQVNELKRLTADLEHWKAVKSKGSER